MRKDIQGLRAVAVLVVVLDHLLGWPRGGFVGVDMFFVVSGFLITDLMLRERERTGRISYLGFYRRRIRRIIPLSLFVLTTTVAASYLVYRRGRADIVLGDGLWALAFLSNWHFAAAKTDYFNNEDLVSPLQHFWSLAVEEQFYVVWPIVVIGLALVAVTRPQYRRWLGCLLALVVITSFGFAMYQSVSEATVAYFSTASRAWELGVGALVAIAVPHLSRLPAAARTALAWIGLSGIMAGTAVISPTSSFPGPWAALPVLATACVIVAGTGVPTYRGLWLLSNPVSQYVGNVSYSLYLWHFPAIVLLGTYFADLGRIELDALILSTTSVLTVFSFHLVEDPIRRSSWLEARRTLSRRKSYRDSLDPLVLHRLGNLGLTTVFVGTLAMVAVVLQPVSPVSTGALTGQDEVGFRSEKRLPKTPEGRLQRAIQASVATNEFPELRPKIDDLAKNKAPQWSQDGCGTTGPWNADECTYGRAGAPRTAAVFGDSIALSWLPGLINALGDHGFRVHSFVAGQCPAADVRVGDSKNRTDCRKHRTWALDAIARLQPDLIVMSDASSLVRELGSGARGEAAVAEWREGTSRTLRTLTKAGRTLVLTSPPGTKNLLACATARATPSDCLGQLDSAEFATMLEAEKFATRATGAELIDTADWFCDEYGRCPAFVGTMPVYVDGIHLSRQYSSRLAPLLWRAIERRGHPVAKKRPKPSAPVENASRDSAQSEIDGEKFSEPPIARGD